MDVGEEPGRNQSSIGLARVVVRLGVVEVHLRDARRRDIGADERLGVLDRESHVGQPALIGAPCGIADHDR